MASYLTSKTNFIFEFEVGMENGKPKKKRVTLSGVRNDITADETRTTDKALTLTDRSNIERKKKCDYFISFHRNAAANPSANGVETFVFTINNSKSMPLATAIQKALVGIGSRDRGVKTANFHVLRETYSPAVLLEVGFISNASDNMLFDSRFEDIAKAIAGAIIGVCGKANASSVKRCSACGQVLQG